VARLSCLSTTILFIGDDVHSFGSTEDLFWLVDDKW
jgi:hypothetical protein